MNLLPDEPDYHEATKKKQKKTKKNSQQFP